MAKVDRPHLLVVGGTGFIGYHLVLTAKNKGWKVSSLSLNKPKKHRYVGGVNYLKADITNFKDLKKKLKKSYTYVVNLGGYVNHSFLIEERDSIIKDHFIGLINLTTILFDKKIKKFVQIGSSTEYGKIKPPYNENNLCLPNSPYATAKLKSTRFLMSLCNTNKFPATVLRLFQIYGPKQDQNRFFPQIIKGCLKNEKFPTSKGNQIRDFCYIDDAINAIFLALKSNKSSGQIFNIGSGKPIKIKKTINIIRKIIGKGQAQFGGIKYRKGESMKIYPNIKKARFKLKWKPKISFNRGIHIVINSFR